MTLILNNKTGFVPFKWFDEFELWKKPQKSTIAQLYYWMFNRKMKKMPLSYLC